ncbi:OVARIAN TUMOR DOMAIN-containing deubiquitinating enzyme 4 [Coffea arabica]|uniref:Ubiquitin thioesterase OTU n=1 Tax=Coffea arabica TaxID=13443 RepID=A0A6P6SI12_COFAR|nr:OTU domain-containing protein At3g57810-like [Coffea arabica]
MARSSISIYVRNMVLPSGSVHSQISNSYCSVTLRAPSNLCFLHVSTKHPKLKLSAIMPLRRTSSYSSPVGFQASQRSCFGSCISKPLSKGHSLTVRSRYDHGSLVKSCLDISLRSPKLNVRLLAPCQTRIQWSQRLASAGLFIGLVCCSSSEPVRADALEAKQHQEASYSHGKIVCNDYSVIGIPGDGRCLFRSVAHGACLRAGKPAPDEKCQRELADELRARVADEFVKRRKETEWFIEGDFDTYVSNMRKPHVWGGEPELLMAAHVLQMPITVYMRDQDSGGLISIAEYGQEYGKDDPIKVLYHGFGHYDALHIPRKTGARSRL